MKHVFILIFCITFFSCNKNEDISDVIITINSPKDGSAFPANQRVPIQIDLSVKDGLDVFHFRVVELTTNRVVVDWQQDTRSLSLFR